MVIPLRHWSRQWWRVSGDHYRDASILQNRGSGSPEEKYLRKPKMSTGAEAFESMTRRPILGVLLISGGEAPQPCLAPDPLRTGRLKGSQPRGPERNLSARRRAPPRRDSKAW
jgi:hypothetical protein